MKARLPHSDLSLLTGMLSRLRRVEHSVLELFYSVIPLIAPCSDRHYCTNVPDYRFFKKYVFCILIPMIRSPVLRIDLRSDRVPITSRILHLEDFDMESSGQPGSRWVHFNLPLDTAAVGEALKLISRVSAENTELTSAS